VACRARPEVELTACASAGQTADSGRCGVCGSGQVAPVKGLPSLIRERLLFAMEAEQANGHVDLPRHYFVVVSFLACDNSCRTTHELRRVRGLSTADVTRKWLSVGTNGKEG
jgi:hypothetical protein